MTTFDRVSSVKAFVVDNFGYDTVTLALKTDGNINFIIDEDSKGFDSFVEWFTIWLDCGNLWLLELQGSPFTRKVFTLK